MWFRVLVPSNAPALAFVVLAVLRRACCLREHTAQYLIVPNAKLALRYSTAATLLALFVFGWVKAVLIGSPKRGKSAVETLVVGGAAAAAAFFLAKLFPVDL